MKRSSDPSLPTPESKYPRKEIPPPSFLKLKHLREDLQYCKTPESTDKVPDFDLDGVYAAACSALTSLPGNTYLSKIVSKEVFKANVQEQREHFFQSLMKVDDSSFDVWTLIAHGAFWTGPPSRIGFGLEPVTWNTSEESQQKAIENSWTADFIDQSSLECLRAHVVERLQFQPSLEMPIDGRYCSIIQSSGMGKSRLLDEFSKTYFLIPINLRASTDRGYPPADRKVREFLTQNSLGSSPASLINHFLLALFNKTEETLGRMGSKKSERIQEFRSYMSKDQSMQSPGKNRTDFYDGVIAQARRGMSRSSSEPDTAEIAQALDGLRKVLNSGKEQSSKHCIFFGNDHHRGCVGSKYTNCVDVFIVFDEAHTLADCFDNTDAHESRFVVVKRILSWLSSYPLYSFFLSTTGKITQFSQPRGQVACNRIMNTKLAMPHLYTHLGFDQLMQSRKVLDRWTTLDHVISLECIAHMGRPLWGTRYDHGNEEVRLSLLNFAIQKLLCGNPANGALSNAQVHAVLSQRLALDVNTSQYFFGLSSPLNAMLIMHEQIADHMLVSVAVGSGNCGIESLRGIASSEPILSEAASVIMSTDQFDLPRALSLVLKGFNVDQGHRGELLVAAFFAWARDKVVSSKHPRVTQERVTQHFSVWELFSRLFSNSVSTSISRDFPSLCHTGLQQPFKAVFEKANMHFNHVLKPQVQKLLARQFLLSFMARGAAALGAICQPGFDAVYPYLYDSLDLDVKSVGFIIVQVKNDSNTSRSDDAAIFKKMDPFKCGLLNDSDMVDGRFPIPIIRLLFSLSLSGTEEPTVTRMKYKVPSDGAMDLKDGQPLFTSYDFVCRGVSSDVLQPVGVSSDVWAALVNESDQWSSLFNVPASNVLRSQIPGRGDHEAHFSSWLGVDVFP